MFHSRPHLTLVSETVCYCCITWLLYDVLNEVSGLVNTLLHREHFGEANLSALDKYLVETLLQWLTGKVDNNTDWIQILTLEI